LSEQRTWKRDLPFPGQDSSVNNQQQ
jgi:hypothetical protein